MIITWTSMCRMTPTITNHSYSALSSRTSTIQIFLDHTSSLSPSSQTFELTRTSHTLLPYSLVSSSILDSHTSSRPSLISTPSLCSLLPLIPDINHLASSLVNILSSYPPIVHWIYSILLPLTFSVTSPHHPKQHLGYSQEKNERQNFLPLSKLQA